jgi:hypothetical protein
MQVLTIKNQVINLKSLLVGGGQSYSYSVTKLQNKLLFVVTSNVFVTF